MSTSPVNLNSSTPVTASPAASSPSSSAGTNASAQNAIDALGNPDTFLQLLVAQLQYQDPESPADGTTFVTQLATFSGVEEQSAMRSDLDSINGVAQQWSASQTAASTAASSTTTTPAAGSTGADSTTGTNATPAAGSAASPSGSSN
jgi:flagellar basal-body rod modification protein FlgD